MISSEDLRGLIDEDMSLLEVCFDVVLDFIEVNVWCPAVDVHYC